MNENLHFSISRQITSISFKDASCSHAIIKRLKISELFPGRHEPECVLCGSFCFFFSIPRKDKLGLIGFNNMFQKIAENRSKLSFEKLNTYTSSLL